MESNLLTENTNNIITGCIYRIVNNISGKIYIGQTTGPISRRWREHKCRASRNDEHQLYADMREYGFENFSIQIIENDISLSNIQEREDYYINLYDTINNGYNTLHSAGATNNKIVHADVLSLWQNGKRPIEIAKILNCNPGSISLILHKMGISKEEIRKRETDYLKIKLGKEIEQYDLNGNYIKTYLSSIFTEEDGFCPSEVLRCCNYEINLKSGKRLAYSHKGYLFKFKDDNTPIQILIERNKNKPNTQFVKANIDVSKDDFYQYYVVEKHTRSETCNHFGITRSLLARFIKENNMYQIK